MAIGIVSPNILENGPFAILSGASWRVKGHYFPGAGWWKWSGTWIPCIPIIYIYIYVYMYIYIYEYVYIYMYIHMYVWYNLDLYVHLYYMHRIILLFFQPACDDWKWPICLVWNRTTCLQLAGTFNDRQIKNKRYDKTILSRINKAVRQQKTVVSICIYRHIYIDMYMSICINTYIDIYIHIIYSYIIHTYRLIEFAEAIPKLEWCTGTSFKLSTFSSNGLHSQNVDIYTPDGSRLLLPDVGPSEPRWGAWNQDVFRPWWLFGTILWGSNLTKYSDFVDVCQLQQKKWRCSMIIMMIMM